MVSSTAQDLRAAVSADEAPKKPVVEAPALAPHPEAPKAANPAVTPSPEALRNMKTETPSPPNLKQHIFETPHHIHGGQI